MDTPAPRFASQIPFWLPMVFGAMAGGMAWGIRGQYGHETGAMIAGLLVSSTLIVLLCPTIPLATFARTVALCTVAMGFGGSMTYGQTIGLTQNTPVVGNWAAFAWGMVGLAIKGGAWIGFAGAFLGMGLGGVRYRAREILALLLAMLGAYLIGTTLLNGPFYPSHKILPYFYFSASWHWEPGAVDLEPRREDWGGQWCALVTLITYVTLWRKDILARNLAFWGILGGALGFPGGQCLQAIHAWNPSFYADGWFGGINRYMNWWNMMETTFGAIMGAALGLGLWRNRAAIVPEPAEPVAHLSVPVECVLIVAHAILITAHHFSAWPLTARAYDLGLMMGVIPLVAIVGGRYAPALIIFPVTLIPIAGKTLLSMSYQPADTAVEIGWVVYIVLPLSIAVAASVWFWNQEKRATSVGKPAAGSLLINAWMYFLLNFAFFRFPFPWAEWTGRTPNGIIFTVCVIGLTGLALYRLLRTSIESETA